MLKWILNKSIRFQITLILVFVLCVPTAVLVWNVFLPSKVETVVKSMQEENLNSILFYIDDEFDKTELAEINANKGDLNKLEKDINSKLGLLSKISRGTNIGIYLPKNNKSYTYGVSYDKEVNFIHEINTVPLKEQIKGMDEIINAVIKTKEDKADYITYRNKEILRCFHPIIVSNEVVAVAWADTLLPPELNYHRLILIFILFIGPAILIIALILMVVIVKNLNKNILKIRNGLEIIGSDLSYRIEDMGGDIGKIVGSINTMADSLKKKEQLEERLQRTEKLASLGQMISGVSHEIRNPLGIISGTVQLMEKNYKHVEGLDEYIIIVKEQCDRENKVIQELLDYARPAKKLMMQMDINVLISSILSFTKKYIHDNHIKLNLELENDLPQIFIDCDKIKQVFVNIVINACEAMDTGGTLNIGTKQEGEFLKIYFKDTGKGMDEIQMDNIFNPYYTTKIKGTGLGLAISNGIVELHGGYIEVKSKKNQGSIFIVVLPLNGKEGELFG